MAKTSSQVARRIIVVLLYGIQFALSIWVLYQAIPIPSLDRWAVPMLFGITILLFYIYVASLRKTGVWNMIMGRNETLDERQIMIRNKAYQKSYALLLILIINLCVNIMMGDPNLIAQRIEYFKVVVVTLFFVGISLPFTILAWTEEEV